MRSHPYLLQGLKYATLTLALIVIVIIAAALMRQANSSSLSGRLVAPQASGDIPTLHFDANRAVQGFTVPADSHVIFTVPPNTRIPRITFLGGTDLDQTARYWGYCFSGREASNKANGAQGEALYDGRYFYSLAERKAQAARPIPADSDLLGIKNYTGQGTASASIAEIFYGSDTCYVMSAVDLPAGIDSDDDYLNNKREQVPGTDPNNPDTDRDGITDGNELFVTKTNPRSPDTDNDGLGDRTEDENANGRIEKDETSPLNPDTDRDELCDGNGLASGCPEETRTLCTQGVGSGSSRTCNVYPSSPVYGEDMNQNGEVDKDETDPRNPRTYGIDDWDYKWNLFQSKDANKNVQRAPGRVAPVFPIPAFPQSQSSSSSSSSLSTSSSSSSSSLPSSSTSSSASSTL